MRSNKVSRFAFRSCLAVFLGSIVAPLAGCHSLHVAPVAVALPSPGTVRVLGAVALPQVVTIPPEGLNLVGALELAGGIATSTAQTAFTSPPPASGPAVSLPGGVPSGPRTGAGNPGASTPVDPGSLLIGLRRIVNGVPNTTYFAVPLVLKYDAGAIPLQDGDQIRVVPYKTTSLFNEAAVPPANFVPSPRIALFSGTPLTTTIMPLTPGSAATPYDEISKQIKVVGDPGSFSVMQSLTRVNSNDNGIETFIIPSNKDQTNSIDPFPQWDSKMRDVMKAQDGDIFGLTTLPQVAAIAVPKLTDATNTLLDLARAAQEPAESESRLRRSLNSLRQGQIPQAPTLPTMPTLPRSLDLPDSGAIRARLHHLDGIPSAHKTGIVGIRRNLDEAN